MTEYSFDRPAFFAGFRDVIPIALPGIPFGLVLGFLISEAGIDRFAGWSSSWIILAGAAQLAAIELLAEQASAAVVLVTIAFVNSRHLMYSAALRQRFAPFPNWFRIVGPYVLLDQSFALANGQPNDLDNRYRMWHYFGSATFLFVMWQTVVGVGVIVGDVIRAEWQLTFAVPILFGSLMLLSITNRAGVAAAVVGGVVALLGSSLPQGSGVLLGIVLGVAAGAAWETRLDDTAGSS